VKANDASTQALPLVIACRNPHSPSSTSPKATSKKSSRELVHRNSDSLATFLSISRQNHIRRVKRYILRPNTRIINLNRVCHVVSRFLDVALKRFCQTRPLSGSHLTNPDTSSLVFTGMPVVIAACRVHVARQLDLKSFNLDSIFR
jgi:hypothetical protein